MVEFVLERVISAAPERVFAVALDPGLHLRSMQRYGAAGTANRSPWLR